MCAARRAEARDRPPHPGEHVLERCSERGGDQRERRQDRDRVPVRGPGQAVEAVPAEAGAPVLPRLEQGEREAGRDEEDSGADDEPREAKRRRRGVRQQRPLAHAESREPDDGGRDDDSQNDRNDRDDRQRRAPGPALEGLRQRRGRERVRDRPGREDDERAAPEPGRRSEELHGRKDTGVTSFAVLATVVAHIFGGTPAAVDYRATITHAPPGVEAKIVAGDRLWLKLPNGQIHEHRLYALDGRWRVPAGAIGIVSGTLVKLPRPAVWPWIALGVLLATAAAARIQMAQASDRLSSRNRGRSGHGVRRAHDFGRPPRPDPARRSRRPRRPHA